MRRAVEAPPQLADGELLDGMHELGGERGERTEHVSALEQIRTRQLEPVLIADQIAIQQHIEVHRAWRPARRVALAAAVRLDGMELCQHAVQRQVRVEGRNEIYEVLALEADRTIAIPGREARPRKLTPQLRHRARQVALGGDVTPGADVDGRHGVSFRRPPACAPQRPQGGRREYARSPHRHRASYEW